MIEEHRGQGRHDNLMRPLPPDEDASGWMVSYIDVMTLLVALLVLIITLGEIGTGSGTEDAAVEPHAGPLAAVNHGVPLPEPLQRVVAGRENMPVERGSVSARAISAALGVAGLPASRPAQPPRLLARADSAVARGEALSDGPQWLMPTEVDPSRPLADYLVVLTDSPPLGVEKVDNAAIDGARFVTASLEDAQYLADLAGMEVSRIPEGVRLRVEDRLLFPTAEAELTEAGRALVTERLHEMVQRHPGEVAVEGIPTVDRSIPTVSPPTGRCPAPGPSPSSRRWWRPASPRRGCAPWAWPIRAPWQATIPPKDVPATAAWKW